MKRFISRWMLGMLLAALGVEMPVRADSPHFWTVTSPDHGQTYAYGSEQQQVWMALGNDRHLALETTFTNDPYIEGSAARRYDDFTFHFPAVKLGTDGRTFSYRTAEGLSIPVAIKRRDFFGVEEIHLLPNASLVVDKRHGYLSLTLVILDHPVAGEGD
jgi:hypothetical protein